MMQRATVLRWDELAATYRGWTADFLTRPSGLRIAGRPVVSFLNLTDFVAAYGLYDFAIMVRGLRTTVRRILGEDPFVVGLFNECSRRNVWLANRLDLDAATGYGMLPNWRGEPVQQYADLIEQRVSDWHWMQRGLRVPFLPVVCCGWDASMRGQQLRDLRQAPGFPWRPVVDGVTDQLFAHFTDQAIAFNREHHSRLDVVFIHAWNEWTEQSAIEPSDRFGTGLLETVARRA